MELSGFLYGSVNTARLVTHVYEPTVEDIQELVSYIKKEEADKLKTPKVETFERVPIGSAEEIQPIEV